MDRVYNIKLPAQYLEKPMYAFTGERNLNASGSVPSTITDIPTGDSDASQWMNWHKELKSRYGLDTANSLWMLAWKKYGSTGIFGTSTADLRAYMLKQGITLDKNALASVEDTGLGILGGIGSALKVGEYITIAVIIIMLGGTALLVYGLFKHPEVAGKAARAAAL